MGIPQRMAVIASSLVFAGAVVLTTGAAAPAGAASAGTVPGTAVSVNAASVNPARLTLSSSWCSRHPWKCRGFRNHHKFRHHKFRHHRFDRHGRGGWGGWGGRSVSIHNENINISSSSSQFHGW